ncbi:MAG: aminotransferase class I/II-fold pyridoxal phosphate-dependent enzyme [Oleispira antarctica]|nr:aminotransferase class I/II-fold pyridoxal phosphate-dependent enzyme [Oleispira antarctica]MBQ0793573.1 aminotransferase class I/II-fold pyridoxal phosphate-dependent enzyme [Oleispira antarctica]
MNTLYPPISSAVEIANYFSSLIRNEDMQPGDSLPSVRQLAGDLGINPNTVASAYAKLRDAGLITTGGRRGSRVAERQTTFDIGSGAIDGLFDLSQGNMDPDLIPSLSLLSGFKNKNMSGYDININSPELLNTASDWFLEQKIPELEIGVFSGALDAMERALRARTLPGDRVWVEDPCWPPLLKLLNYLHLKAVPLSMDSEGCTLPANDGKVCSAVILTPRAQNPTGISLTPARASEWTGFFKDHPDCLLIIDDFWGPLTDKSFSIIENPQAQLYILSLSKFLGPDLRISIVNGSSQMVAEMQRQQLIGPRWVSHILQDAAASLWKIAVTKNLLNIATESYQLRRKQLLNALPLEITSDLLLGDGIHLWIPVLSETAVVQHMAAKGWAIQEGSPFRLNSPSAVRISLGNVKENTINQLASDLIESLKKSEAGERRIN